MHPPLLQLQEALDRRLADADRVAIDEHLESCDACRRHLHALRWTRVRLAGAGGRRVLPAALEAEVRRVAVGILAPAGSLPPSIVPMTAPTGPAGPGWRRFFEWWRGSRPQGR